MVDLGTLISDQSLNQSYTYLNKVRMEGKISDVFQSKFLKRIIHHFIQSTIYCHRLTSRRIDLKTTGTNTPNNEHDEDTPMLLCKQFTAVMRENKADNVLTVKHLLSELLHLTHRSFSTRYLQFAVNPFSIGTPSVTLLAITF